MSDMNKMTMHRIDLIAALKKNRDTHREIFEKAQIAYREAVIEELDRMLADARKGRNIQRMLTLPEPEDHTRDYDQAIRMLDMCIDKDIEITTSDFQCLVMDEWGWKRAWVGNTQSYTQ